MDYETFRETVRTAAERRATQGHLVPVPDLRRECGQLDRHTFDAYLLSLHREGAIHLLSHVEPHTLSDDVRGDCLVLAQGPALYWVRWL